MDSLTPYVLLPLLIGDVVISIGVYVLVVMFPYWIIWFMSNSLKNTLIIKIKSYFNDILGSHLENYLLVLSLPLIIYFGYFLNNNYAFKWYWLLDSNFGLLQIYRYFS
jgi:hypothetical protein